MSPGAKALKIFDRKHVSTGSETKYEVDIQKALWEMYCFFVSTTGWSKANK